MKKKLFLLLTMVIASQAFSQNSDESRVVSRYCELLGLKTTTLDGKFSVILPDGNSVSPYDFYLGRAGQDYNYCAKNGYSTVLKNTKGRSILKPFCHDKESGKIIPLNQLIYNNDDYQFLYGVGADLPDPDPDM